MTTLEYFDGTKWNFVSKWPSEALAWTCLGTDNFNYRTVDEKGNVLTDMSKQKFENIDHDTDNRQ